MAVNFTLSKIVHFHRKKAQMNRKDLADLAGVGKTVIYDIEHGKETIKWKTVKAVLKALNVEINFRSPLMEDYEKSQSENA